MIAWLRRKLHRCDLPETKKLPLKYTWRCPISTCGLVWEVAEWHVEDIVAVDNASNVDIGYDIRGWQLT